MPFDWREFLALSNDLRKLAAAGRHQEAALRSAVSRAYYAAFCFARDQARAKLGYVSPRTPEEHAELQRFLAANKYGKAASQLERLRQWRNKCDYDDQPGTNFAILAENAVNEAARVIAALG